MSSPAPQPELRKILIDLATMSALCLVLALIGPFGSFSLPFAWRLVYWIGLGWGGYACYRPIAGIVVNLARDLALPEPAAWVVGCLIATIPMTVLVWAIGRLPGPFPIPSLEEAIAMYGYVLIIGGSLTAIFYFLERHKSIAAAAAPIAPPIRADGASPIQPEAQAESPPRFLERIPRHLGIDLIALEMEDHYLRVHTRLGSDLILLRMRDAVAELDGLAGAQVHRSWWVARSAVTGVERDGRNVRLLLESELQVPVARDAVSKLRDSGWF